MKKLSEYITEARYKSMTVGELTRELEKEGYTEIDERDWDKLKGSFTDKKEYVVLTRKLEDEEIKVVRINTVDNHWTICFDGAGEIYKINKFDNQGNMKDWEDYTPGNQEKEIGRLLRELDSQL